MKQVPRGPEELNCPQWQKPMSEVCHKCPKWIQVRGKNPNTGQDVDEWNCADALLPMLLIEVAQQARQAGAATESFRNEVVDMAQKRARVVEATHTLRQINGNRAD